MSNFFTIFTNAYKEEVKIFEEKLNEHEEMFKYLEDTILSANLSAIYDIFKSTNQNTSKLMTKIINELLNPLELYRNTQFTIYQNQIDDLRALNKVYKENKDILEISRHNYYKAADVVKKESQGKILLFSRAENNNYDLNISNKMKAKNYEIIYKYELEKFNKSIPDINSRYHKIHDEIKTADKSRIMFIKTLIWSSSTIFII